MDGADKGKHYDNPKMEYYKVEAVSKTFPSTKAHWGIEFRLDSIG